MRVPGEETIAITPSGKGYDKLSPQEICIVDYSGAPVERGPTPSIETGLHLAVYQNRFDIGAVLHTHQVYASIFAVINQPIPPLFDEAVMALGPVIEVVPYALSGSTELVQNVTARLSSGGRCYLLQNHGALVLDTGLEQAYCNVELLEKCARVYYYALATGKKIATIPENVQKVLGTGLPVK